MQAYIDTELSYNAIAVPFNSPPFSDDFVCSPLQTRMKLEFILAKGRNCLVFKKDLRRAYRQFPFDPKDYSLLGFCYQGKFYFDTRCPFGLRSSALICHRTTQAVVHIFNEQEFSADVYLDDFYGAQYPSLATQAFSQLGQLRKRLA